MIKPTAGKRLWYWPIRATGADEPYDLTNQPLAAFITHVNADGTVNIAYLDRNGAPDSRLTVQLWQRQMQRPMGSFCEYHPDDVLQPLLEVKDNIIQPTKHNAAFRETLSLKKSAEGK